MAEGSSDPQELHPAGGLEERNGSGSWRGRSRWTRHPDLNASSHQRTAPRGDRGPSAALTTDQPLLLPEGSARGWARRGGDGRGGGRGHRRGGGRQGSHVRGAGGYNGGLVGPDPRWPRSGGDGGPFRGPSGRGSGSPGPSVSPAVLPVVSEASWRREDGCEDPQNSRPKNPRRFHQEQRGGEWEERRGDESHFRRNQENQGYYGNHANRGKHRNQGNQRSQDKQATVEGFSPAEHRGKNHRSEMRERSRRGPEPSLQRLHHQGPIRTNQTPSQEDLSRSEEREGSPEDPGRIRPSLSPARREAGKQQSGRDKGRAPAQRDGGQQQRRAPHLDQRPGQGRWDHMSKSKETQTGCLIEQLSEEKYECMVCCDVIRLMAPVWSCHGCYHVFHLNCIKKWARSPASQAEESTEGWRCPACQNVALKQPVSYTCFCGKVTNPEWQRSEIPHSCGDLCGKKRTGADCPHSCNILCHPGPCPQCPAIVTKPCLCGKTSQPVRCGQAAVLQCHSVCEATLNCNQHTCNQVCHAGSCQPCQLQVQQVCYCGGVTREVLCGTDQDRFEGRGHFTCQKTCGKALGCGVHRCLQPCHAGACQPCPRSPSLVKSCPCGQTALAKLLELGYAERHTCSDPIPSCGKTCNKPLACGSNDSIHFCQGLCHEGACVPCPLSSTVTCRCGSKTTEVPCATIHKEEQPVFTCEKRCNRRRACGRHRCTQLCCMSTDHKCLQICGHKLSCGLHRCQEPCHRGNCQPCWQASFEELTCHCGLTILYPPVACGTLPPECKNLCTRRHECEHPVFHNCHSEDRCPPCTYLTQKWCMGNHEQRSNIPCHLQDISCGLTCNKTLPCQMHRCKRICHRGDCLAEGSCSQPCLLPRSDCGHPCSAPCHTGSGCPRNPCTTKVALQCDCGRRKETVMCPEAASSYQRYAAIAMASKLSDMQPGDSMDIGQFITKKEMKANRLECDEECATLERNRRLAEALQIDASLDPFNVRSTSKYSESLKDDARKELRFVSDVEKEVKNLVDLTNKGKQAKRSHSFPSMKREHRKLVHELAEAYGVESVSYDSEPKRNVVITAYKGRSQCPTSTLTSLIERESATRAPPPIAHIKQHSNRVESGGSWSKMLKEEPVIDYFDVQD